MKNPQKTIWPTDDGHSPVIPFFASIGPLSKKAVKLFDQNCFPVFIEKGKYLMKPGSTADNLYFIHNGVIQGFYKEEDTPVTTWISAENEVVGSIRTLGTTEPCTEYLQALEDCELVGMPVEFLEFVFSKCPETNYICRRLWEVTYRGAEERAYISRIPSAEKKYQRFLFSHANLVDRISLKYVASFLGITLETLSRVRNREKKIVDNYQ
jgi:CRP-like cAMP-binding protein